MIFDVLIIGCGIIGAASAYELSRYNITTAILEKFNDVANGVTKANSAILHAGFDCIPGSLEADLNLKGIRLARELCEKLDVPRKDIPTLVIALDPREIQELETLYDRGIKNGTPGIRLIGREEALALEPALNPNLIAALYAPGSAIIEPWEYAIALAETAVENGAELYLNTRVITITKQKGLFYVGTSKGEFCAKYIVNAAGCDSDKIHGMVGGRGFKSTHFKGSYYVLDKAQGVKVNSVIFPCPDEHGFKGILVAPTVHGNLICGPDSERVTDAIEVGTTFSHLEQIKAAALRSVPAISFKDSIRQYAGVRPNTQVPDFIIGESDTCKGFINLAGIKSPGLSAAPAIAQKGVECLHEAGLGLSPKENFLDERRVTRFKALSWEEQNQLIKKNPLYGHVICRCETITEGEIVNAIRRPIVPTTLDAVKRRTGAGFGRCQGSFCGPRVHAILSRELGIPMNNILMDEEGTYILTGLIKGGTGHV